MSNPNDKQTPAKGATSTFIHETRPFKVGTLYMSVVTVLTTEHELKTQITLRDNAGGVVEFGEDTYNEILNALKVARANKAALAERLGGSHE